LKRVSAGALDTGRWPAGGPHRANAWTLGIASALIYNGFKALAGEDKDNAV
jgi:hypothetical protein